MCELYSGPKCQMTEALYCYNFDYVEYNPTANAIFSFISIPMTELHAFKSQHGFFLHIATAKKHQRLQVTMQYGQTGITTLMPPHNFTINVLIKNILHSQVQNSSATLHVCVCRLLSYSDRRATVEFFKMT